MMFLQNAVVAALVAVSAFSTTQAANLRKLGSGSMTYSSSDSAWKQAMLEAVNAERSKNGLSALCLNSKLTSAAQGHSDDMAANNYMDHNGADGSTMSSRITASGYDWTYIEENVAAGQVDVDAVMTSWMNSEGHRANILGKDVTMFGCGYAYNADTTYGHYWTQDFGASSVDECDGGSSSASTATTQSDEVAGEADTTPEATTAAPVATPAATTTVETEAPVVTPAPTTVVETEAPAATPAATTTAPKSSDCESRF